MNFEILSVGTELLLGSIVNTNAQYLSRRLSELGFNVFYTTVVGDNPERLKEALKVAAGRSDAVITTGGLGPTVDDLTKETVAEYCGLKCVVDEESKERLFSRFSKSNSNIPENNFKQADMPEGCIILQNDNGTAPGAVVETDDCIFIMLPGPPSEMKPMFDNKVEEYLEKYSDGVIRSKTLRVFGLGESAIDEMLFDLMKESTNPTLAPYSKTGEVELRITAKADSIEKAKEMLKPLEEKVREILGDKVYGTGMDNSLESATVKVLREKGLKATAAESCTGGLISEKITRIRSSSECFDCGFVTYSNKKKSNMLGVKYETLEKYGAVSEETALEMSAGALKNSGSDIAVSVTGIAGPDGGTIQKPVGLVYISICTKSFHKAYKFRFGGDRNMVRERSSMYALDLIRRCALGIIY